MTSKLRHFMDDDESTLVKLTRRTRVSFGQTPQGWVDDETFHDIQEAIQASRPMASELWRQDTALYSEISRLQHEVLTLISRPSYVATQSSPNVQWVRR